MNKRPPRDGAGVSLRSNWGPLPLGQGILAALFASVPPRLRPLTWELRCWSWAAGRPTAGARLAGSLLEPLLGPAPPCPSSADTSGDSAAPGAPLLSARRGRAERWPVAGGGDSQLLSLLQRFCCCWSSRRFKCQITWGGHRQPTAAGASATAPGARSGSPRWDLVLGRSPQGPLLPFLFLLLSLPPPPPSWGVSAKPCGLVVGCELIKEEVALVP